MANKNTLRRKAAAADAFGRIKHNHARQDDVALAVNVGRKARISKWAKVAASGNKPQRQGPR
jgi:hypothetical protein